MHTELRQCTSDCRKYGCPEEDLCAHCGENKWENTEKHMREIIKYMQEKVAECQKIMSEGVFKDMGIL